MNKQFGDFATAKAIKSTVEKIASDKVEQLRPALKTAIVDSINTAEKYCMVTYVGESLSVKVPYNNVAPSYVGQFVRVGGPANDRRIEEVLGQTDSEDRLGQLEKRCAYLEQKAYAIATATADFSATTGVPKAPINSIIGTPKNIDVNSLGEFTVSIPGVYEYYARVQTAAYRDIEFNMYVAHLPSGGVQHDIDRVANVYLWGSGEYTQADTLTAHGIYHLGEGDKIYVNMGASGTATCRAWGTRLWLKLIDPDVLES